jgi:hypothetical protein
LRSRRPQVVRRACRTAAARVHDERSRRLRVGAGARRCAPLRGEDKNRQRRRVLDAREKAGSRSAEVSCVAPTKLPAGTVVDSAFVSTWATLPAACWLPSKAPACRRGCSGS